MKQILLFGAGKSATVLINYLSDLVENKNWHLIVADSNTILLEQKVKHNAYINSILLNIENAEVRKDLISKADVVISMMPPHLHYLIALDCITYKKHLLTASYVDDKIKEFADEIKNNDCLFLCEMGLDPGIDHMSAMQIIHSIKEKNGTITSFKSHCGGLVAPESDNNPWHYKISWNPRNIVLAGKAGAIYKENNRIINIAYEQLFNARNTIITFKGDEYAYYPNRDSLSYISLYHLEIAETFIRTTLRHPDFCTGWKNIVELRLTDEEKVYDTTEMSFEKFFNTHFIKNGFENWISNLKSLNTIESAKSLQQLIFLGIENTTLINKGFCSAADILQFILEQKLLLTNADKDLVVMIHEIEYILNNKKYQLSSMLEIIGDNNIETAMAKTVGLPLGIAAKLILENKISVRGLHIPVIAEIYTPVLEELSKNNVSFKEIIKEL